MTREREILDRHHDTYRRESPYDDAMRRYTFQAFQPFLTVPDATALEFGCSDGLMTQLIADRVRQVYVVEGSSKFIEEARARQIPNATFVHSLFEEFQSPRRFQYIFATYVLTHVEDVTRFVDRVRALLAPGGLFFVAVPNARVLSRQLARHMGLLDDLFALSDNDRSHGHCRAYDRVRLDRDLHSGGFHSLAQGGILLKPLADFQMDEMIRRGVLGQAQMDGLFSLGLEYPDLCGALHSVCLASTDS